MAVPQSSRSVAAPMVAHYFGARIMSVRHVHVGTRQCLHVKTIGVAGIPFSHGQRRGGVEEGPKFLRDVGILDRLRSLGHSVEDFGDVSVEGELNVRHGKVLENAVVGATNKNIRDAVQKIVSSGLHCLTLGGDHSCAIGTIAGHAGATHSDVAVIWVDAHADLNTPKSTNTGNMHGMPVSFLIHEMQQFCTVPKGLEWLQPCIHKENFAYIALRDVEPMERYFIDRLGVTCYGMEDVDRLGIRDVIQRVLRKVNPTGTKSLHVSFDIDALDEHLVRSTGTPVAGGLTLREAYVIAEEVCQTDTLRVLDLVEVNPMLGTASERRRTLDYAKEIVASFFGSQRRGNPPRDVHPNILNPHSDT